jgi:hypothetical protein
MGDGTRLFAVMVTEAIIQRADPCQGTQSKASLGWRPNGRDFQKVSVAFPLEHVRVGLNSRPFYLHFIVVT